MGSRAMMNSPGGWVSTGFGAVGELNKPEGKGKRSATLEGTGDSMAKLMFGLETFRHWAAAHARF